MRSHLTNVGLSAGSPVFTHSSVSVILRLKLGRKERGGGKNQDDNQYVLHMELLQFYPFPDTGRLATSQ